MKLKVFREINDAASKYYADKNSFKHDEFLSVCDQILCNFFSDYLDNNFIFSTLSFTKKGKLHLVNEKDSNNGYNFSVKVNGWQSLLAKIKSYIKEIEEDKIISLTNVLLDKNNKQDLFLIHTNNTYHETVLKYRDEYKIQEYTLNKFSFNENPDNFIKENVDFIAAFANKFASPLYTENISYKYGKYIWNYYSLAKDYSTKNANADFLIHFIKPSIVEFDYNLLLSLATNRQLDSDELALVNLLMHRIVSQTAIEKVEEVKQHATRAAISQVMARNMSHNIGSHVMSNLVSDLGKNLFNDKNPYRPDEDIYAIYPDIKSQITAIQIDNSFLDDELQKYIVSHLENQIAFEQLAIYNNYVKCRMDYLSDITFGTPVMQTNKKVINELFQDLDKVRLLLDNISGLSINFPYKINFTVQSVQGVNNELTVAIPNDLLGCQAFYNIIENVIRNTAKHNQGKKNVDGTTITTNVFVNFKEISENEDVNQKNIWYEVEVYDDVHVSDIDTLVKEQNTKINLSVLAENNQLRNSSLGLLEMQASAAYLRKLDIINIESPAYKVLLDNSIHTAKKLNILKAFSKNVDGKNCLAYRFFVSKPTEYLFVGKFEVMEDEARVGELLKMGVWFRTGKEFKDDLEKENGIVFNHQFVLHQADSEVEKLIKSYQTYLPIRIVELSKKTATLINLLKAGSFSEIEKCVWQIWFNRIKRRYETINVITSYNENSAKHKARNRFNIVLLDHNDYWSESIKDMKSKRIDYLEPLSSSGQKTLPSFKSNLNDYLDDEWDELKMYKIFEAAICKVLVIDERIQRLASTKYEASTEKVLIGNIFKYTNIKIPEANPYLLDADNFDQNLSNLVCEYIKREIKDCNFMIIHYSILERMFNDKDPNDASKKDPRINEHLKMWAKSTRIVVTSGRGKPKELPEEVCFVNLSPILNVFTQTRSKYTINYLLNQARK